MFQGHVRSAQDWGDRVRAASSHKGPWPKVSVWHGTNDLTVVPVNAAEIIKQWTNVHGLSASPSRQEIVDGHPRRVWENRSGEVVIEDYIIADMAHGTPIAITSGEERHGVAGFCSMWVSRRRRSTARPDHPVPLLGLRGRDRDGRGKRRPNTPRLEGDARRLRRSARRHSLDAPAHARRPGVD